MFRRRFTRTLAAVALATTMTVAAGCSDSEDSGPSATGGGGALEKVTYLTSFANSGRDAYVWVAKEMNFFKEAGLDVEIKPGQGTGANIQAVTGGQAQFTPIDFTSGLIQMGKGQAKDFVAVAAIQQRTMAAIVSTEGKGIALPKDLEGKKLADAPGSVVRDLFPTYAKIAGVDASTVSWSNGESQNLTGTLAAGDVDGIGESVVAGPGVEAATKKKAVVLPYGDVLADLYGDVLITSATLAKENPDLVTRFATGLLRGLLFCIASPKDAAGILKKNVQQTSPDEVAAELALMAPYIQSNGSGSAPGVLNSQRIARSIALLQGAGAIPPGLTVDQILDFGLTPNV